MDSKERRTENIEDLEIQVDKLQRELSFLGAAVDNMPTPVFIKDEEGCFVFFNKCYADCFGMNREDYIGETVLELDYLPEEERARCQAEDLQLIRSGDECGYYKDFLFSDKKIHPAYYWSKGFVCADTDERGLIGQIVDLSDEQKIKDNLMEMVQGMANLFDHFFVADLENGKFSIIKKDTDTEHGMSIDTTLARFLEETKGRFYNPVTKHNCDWFFTIDGMKQLLKDKDDFYFECRDTLKDEITYGTTMYCIGRKDGEPARVIYAARDITEFKKQEREYRRKLKEANERLKDMANHDGLTGLYNRRGFMEVVNVRFDEDTKAAMLLCDVDKFKSVNDTYGHFDGDKLLKRVAELLSSSFRTNDIIARLGGDEFMAVLVDCKYEDRGFIINKVNAINEALEKADDIPPGSISVGMAFSRHGETKGLYERADKALYRVKEHGRRGCCVYEDEFNDFEELN